MFGDTIMKTLSDMFAGMPAGLICDAMQQDLHLPNQSFSLPVIENIAKPICGPAFTTIGEKIHCSVDTMKYDDVRIKMLADMPAGCVHVLKSNSYYDVAHFGDITALSLKHSGCIGSIIDGTTRDVAEIRAMKYPIGYKATHPKDSIGTWNLVSYGGDITIDDVLINSKCFVHMSLDGVVVIPFEVAIDTIGIAVNRGIHEKAVRDKIIDGIPVLDVYRSEGRW